MPPALTGGAGSDLDEDAQPAFAATASGQNDAMFAHGSVFGEDDGPPLDVLEAQMGTEIAARDRASAGVRVRRPSADNDDDADPKGATVLPELDDLVARLSADVRETLDELFRARFVTVKKLPKNVFKSLSAKGDANPS